MSRITKEEIEKTKCGRFLLSDENIYLSIYSLNSYVFEYNLLNTEDRILYHRLQDKFDARLINRVITRVRKQIIELLDEDKYIEAKVYFKPKKLSENGELEFRPLHSTDLITQIAIVSMLHLFVYEIPEEEEGDPKLRLSNLSRLIPSDFYGNRISVKPEYLFKPWKQQYQKYNQNSNDALMKYHTSLEYKYEVTLDLENFFPTINPIIIYHYVINHLPAYLNDEEREMMKRVLQKLLFCKLTTTFDEKTAKQYYKVTKGAGNYDNVDKKERNEKECWDFKENSDKFVRGIPQGLPQSYFLGNIYMISIAEIFRKKFTGVSYFYVDDSVIFTNDVREDNFKEQLKELNKQIADEANNFEEDSAIYPEETEKFYRSNLYGVNVHLDGKSNYTRLDNLDDSEVYLKCISREMSQAGNDFFRMYSDEENRNLEEKLDVLSKQVKAKRDQLVEEKSQKRDSGNEDAIEKDEDDTQKFEKRLTRYYRFFEYRKQRLVAMHQPENGSDEDYKKKLEKIIYSELSEEDMEDDEKILQAFMNSYGADIWDAAIGMYQTFADDKEQAVLKNYILKINELCYGKASVEFSYLECTYRDLLRNKEENDYSVEDEGDIFEETLKRYMTEDLRDTYNDPYKTLKYLARMRLKKYANKHYEVAEDYSSKLLKKTDEEILKILLSEINACIYKFDRDVLSKAVEKINEEGNIVYFLEEIRSLVDKIPYKRLGLVASALLGLREEFKEENSEKLFTLSASDIAGYLIEDIIERLKTEEEKYGIICSVIENVDITGLGIMARLINRMELAYGRLAGNSEEKDKQIISLTHLEKLEDIYVAKVRDIVNSEFILDRNEFNNVFYLWKCFDKDGVEAYLKGLLKTEVNKLKFICAMATKWHSTNGSGWRFYPQNYSEYISQNEVYNMIQGFDKSKLNQFTDIEQIKLASFALNYNKNEMDHADEQAALNLISEWKTGKAE